MTNQCGPTLPDVGSQPSIIDHKFYRMGSAPYRWVGMWSNPSKALLEVNPHAYNLAMIDRPGCCRSTCDHCGKSIIHHCIIKDSDGILFSVGTSCIEKIGQIELTTYATKANKDRQRLIRQGKAELKLASENAVRKSVLDTQRTKNGGLTDYEYTRHGQHAFSIACSEHNQSVANEFLDALVLTGGSFCEVIYESISQGREITKGAGIVVCEIAAKQHGRKNSKAYLSVIDGYKAKWSLLELRNATDYPPALRWIS
jgi:hypothetical protein